MPTAIQFPPLRRDPAAKAIVLSWRRLTSPPAPGTGGRVRVGPGSRTLIACSGGADSSALVLALAAAAKPGQLAVGHIVHDLRSPQESLADRDAARDLATAAGALFLEAKVQARPAGGNLEAAARRLRYEALAELARAEGIDFIATAHHAGDQAESVLMALLRGSGPRGLGAMARSRRIAPDSTIRLIRPMLRATRADAERICTLAGWTWREDVTNSDTSRLRAAIRLGPARDLAALRPGSEARIARAAHLLRDAAGLVRDRARALLTEAMHDAEVSVMWPRGTLRQERAVVVGETLRLAAGYLRSRSGPGVGDDRITGRLVDPAVAAIRDRSTTPRSFNWPGMTLRVTSKTVTLATKNIND